MVLVVVVVVAVAVEDVDDDEFDSELGGAGSSVSRNASSRSRRTSVSLASIKLKRLWKSTKQKMYKDNSKDTQADTYLCNAVRWAKVKFKCVCNPKRAISRKCTAYRCAMTWNRSRRIFRAILSKELGNSLAYLVGKIDSSLTVFCVNVIT